MTATYSDGHDLWPTEPSHSISPSEILRNYRAWPDGDWNTWPKWFADLLKFQGYYLSMLLQAIQEDGIEYPIVLDASGFVRDGHHRLFCALLLGLDTVPVAFQDASEGAS